MAGIFSRIGNFLFGKPGKYRDISRLTSAQEPLQQQLLRSAMGQGAGGAFGSAADYYRDLLSPDSQTAQMMFDPEMRRFREDILPGISEQFAGMGSGNLFSSGFRNAGIQAGTDLAERLGAIRAQLRSQGASGLANLGGMGLQPTKENIYEPGTPGLVDQALPFLGNVAAMGFSGSPMFNRIQNPGMTQFGSPRIGRNTSPYGSRSNFQMPDFSMRRF